MKKRSSVQITIDENQNIRINNLSLEEYSEIFDDCFEEFNISNYFSLDVNKSLKSISDIKHDIESIIQMYESCDICFRKCKVNRNLNEIGWCELNSEDNVYMSTMINVEERFVCPTYAIYFSSCNICCKYCHQKNFMQPYSRKYISFNYIIEEIKNNIDTIKTISFIGGNPELSILTIMRFIELLAKEKIDIPLVFNSNFLFTEKLYPIIERYFDILIPDFKFWNDECSSVLCGFPNYKNIVQKNISHFINKKRMIIRHLPLRGHWECCSKIIIDWISDQIVNEKYYSLSFLDLLESDNSKDILRCKKYAKKININFS